MRWFGIFLSLSLFSLLVGTSPLGAAPSYYTITGIDPGGVITEYAEKYERLASSGVTVKIDGICASACTMVIALVNPDHICITERGALGVHEASMDGDPDSELTKAWFRMFPEWFLKLVADHGGVQEKPFYLFAEDLKGHINLCPGSVYPNVDMQKLIKTDNEGDGEKIIFKPQ